LASPGGELATSSQSRLTMKGGLMDSNFLSERPYDAQRFWRALSRRERPRREVALALTKEVSRMAVFFLSLGLWAAVWASVASIASAWLQ
jgi:hypothetical protein